MKKKIEIRSRPQMDLKKYVETDRIHKKWNKCREWDDLVSVNIDWLKGKITGRHPISNELRENLDTDNEWTGFLVDVCKKLGAVSIDSQLGVFSQDWCIGFKGDKYKLREKPYFEVITRESTILSFVNAMCKSDHPLHYVAQICVHEQVHIVTEENRKSYTRSCTRSGYPYNLQTTSDMMMCTGEPVLFVTKYYSEDGQVNHTTRLQSSKHALMFYLELDYHLSFADVDTSDLGTLTIVSTKYGDKTRFIEEIKTDLGLF